MPIYEYSCTKCDNVQEKLHGMSEEPKVKCSVCKAKAVRIVSVCGWNLEGEGWYNPHNPKKPARKV